MSKGGETCSHSAQENILVWLKVQQFSDGDLDPLDSACFKMFDVKVVHSWERKRLVKDRKMSCSRKIYVCVTFFITADAKNSTQIVHVFIYLTLSCGEDLS